jgi:TPR repeat protein
MTTVPGTYFIEEQLELDLECNDDVYFLHSYSNQANELTFTVDKVSDDDRTGSDRMRKIGLVYHTIKKQYDKALAWHILGAMKNNSAAYNNIGMLYVGGNGVPQNYLCALKWFLKSAEGNANEYAPINIGNSFENGRGIPCDTYKALEWFCHGGNKIHRDMLKYQGYHLSIAVQSKSNSTIDSLY